MKGSNKMTRKDKFSLKATDLLTGRTMEQDEPELKEEEWYYDDIELIWKRDPGESTLKRIVSFAIPFRQQYPVSMNGFRVCTR